MKSFIILLLIWFSLSYNTANAISYAKKYCSHYNSKYKDYSHSGGDCANFVSQCLIEGGLSLKGCSGLDSKGAIPYVPDLRSCLKQKGWHFTQGVSKKFKAGYPFFEGNSHAMIATGVSGSTITYCGHTNDRFNNQLVNSKYYYYYP